jgi:hypothetical protein
MVGGHIKEVLIDAHSGIVEVEEQVALNSLPPVMYQLSVERFFANSPVLASGDR